MSLIHAVKHLLGINKMYLGVIAMKKLFLFALMALAAGSVSAAPAFTCASPGGPFDGSNPIAGSGDTCSNTNEFSTVCGNLHTFAGTFVYRLNATAASTVSITVTPGNAQYDPAIYLVNASCAQSSGCTDSNDANGPGAAEVLSNESLAVGTYFLVVGSTSTGTTDGSNGCGPFTLTATGALPVKLQKFSVK